MRWKNLTVDEDERTRLPGYRDEAVVRRFDAPEALDTRFYEVRAKSILNRVPEASRMPFRWTVNPYRGCSHACEYCLGPETPILMADGRSKAIADLEVGELISGTVRERTYRRLGVTSVIDKWSSIKPAYVIELDDGSRLVASGDHRFLTQSGWNFVTGGQHGRVRRPHLTVGTKLMGTGGFLASPVEDDDYPLATADQNRAMWAVRACEVARPELVDEVIRRPVLPSPGWILAGLAGTEADAQVTVTSIRPLGEVMRMYDITTGTGDFIANGVVSHNCFARPTHRYLDFDTGRDFEREIVVKVNAPERLRVELARPSWKGEHVALGTNTDPYQWVEGRYRLMPGIWEAFRDAANPCSVLTKSPLLLRDLDLMREINERASFSAAVSVPTLDEKAWRATEPRTPNPHARLEAIGELTRAGIKTGVLIAPLMPGINDSPEQVSRIVELATAAGASFVSGIALHLRGEVREQFFAWLREHRPDLIERYQDLYHHGAYAPIAERRRLTGLVVGPEAPPPGPMRGIQRDRNVVSPPGRSDPQQRLF